MMFMVIKTEYVWDLLVVCVKENAMEEEDPLVIRTLEWLLAIVYCHSNIKDFICY